MISLIPERESLSVEFKSDRKRLSDSDLVGAIVCLANTEGGELYLGVEKDGALTGLHPEHQIYPYEFAQRQSDLGLMDYSGLPVAGATVNDLDILERERLRQMIERYGGDRNLLQLSDEELNGALGFIKLAHTRLPDSCIS